MTASHHGNPARRIGSVARLAAALALGLTVSGCASTKHTLTQTDPWESVNRPIYAFNDGVDRYALKPVAQAYDRYVPEVFRFVAGNFIANLADVYTAANQLLQAKPLAALQDATRFVVNSTFGFLGIGDVATALGLPKHHEDFGQTLGVWGVPSGPYVVLPLFGPSTLRDAPARLADTGYGNALVFTTDDMALRNSVFGLKMVDDRANLLEGEKLLDGISLDRYSLIRDGYLQRRQASIYDGDMPDDQLPNYDDDDDFDPGPTQDAPSQSEPAQGVSSQGAPAQGGPAQGAPSRLPAAPAVKPAGNAGAAGRG